MQKSITFLALITLFVMVRCGSDENDPLVLSKLTITSTNNNLLVAKQTTQLNVSGLDQNNGSFAINTVITWESNNDHVSIDQNGIATGNTDGVSIITAETQNIKATYEITVEDQKLSKLTITSSNGNKLDLNQTTILSTSKFDQINNPITSNITISWSSDNANVTVDQDGLVTGKLVGNSVITAEAEGVKSTFSVNVWDSSAPRTEIYVSDVGVNRNGPHIIFKYDGEGNNGEKFITTNVSRPQDIVFLEDQGIVIISNLQTNTITKYDINSGDYLGVFASGLNGPTRLEIGPDNLIYSIQWNGGPVKRYQQDGTFVDDFTNTSINEAIGIAWDTDGNLYVSSFNNGTNGFVRKYNTSGVDQGLFINNNLNGPTDIWFDENGNMLVNDWSGNRVRKFDSDGNFINNFIVGLSQPEGVDFWDGNILIGNSGDGSVKMFDSNGTFISNIVSPGAAGLTTTNAVTIRHVNK